MSKLVASILRAFSNLRQNWLISSITVGIISVCLFLLHLQANKVQQRLHLLLPLRAVVLQASNSLLRREAFVGERVFAHFKCLVIHIPYKRFRIQ